MPHYIGFVIELIAINNILDIVLLTASPTYSKSPSDVEPVFASQKWRVGIAGAKIAEQTSASLQSDVD